MKVILLKDVKKVGKKDTIIEVSDGYANNYLIKNKLAVPYTKRSKEVLDIEINKRNTIENNKIAEYNEIKKALVNKTLTFKVKTGALDKVFGQVSSKQIADELKKMGFNIDKRCLQLDHPLDTLGLHEIEVALHKEVTFKIKINISK